MRVRPSTCAAVLILTASTTFASPTAATPWPFFRLDKPYGLDIPNGEWIHLWDLPDPGGPACFDPFIHWQEAWLDIDRNREVSTGDFARMRDEGNHVMWWRVGALATGMLLFAPGPSGIVYPAFRDALLLPGDPTGQVWTLVCMERFVQVTVEIVGWADNGDAMLSPGDTLTLDGYLRGTHEVTDTCLAFYMVPDLPTPVISGTWGTIKSLMR